MSVIVRGIEMPKNCALCKFRGAGETWCPFTLQEVPGNTIPEDCPLGPVPPHGDLVERKAVLNTFSTHMNRTMHYVTIRDTVPTIIPADYPPGIPFDDVWAELKAEYPDICLAAEEEMAEEMAKEFKRRKNRETV